MSFKGIWRSKKQKGKDHQHLTHFIQKYNDYRQQVIVGRLETLNGWNSQDLVTILERKIQIRKRCRILIPDAAKIKYN
jgi:flagellar biosynthesis chaperone FliJ